MKSLRLLPLILFSPLVALNAESTPCLSLQSDKVELTGKIKSETFNNPDDITLSLRSETYWMLFLDAPQCVYKGDDEILEKDIEDINKIQLLLTADQYKKYRNLQGALVQVEGNLSAGISAHHYTKVLLSVCEIKPLK